MSLIDDVLENIQNARWDQYASVFDENADTTIYVSQKALRDVKPIVRSNQTIYRDDTFTIEEWKALIDENIEVHFLVVDSVGGEHELTKKAYLKATNEANRPVLVFKALDFDASLTIDGRLTVGCKSLALNSWRKRGPDIAREELTLVDNTILDGIPLMLDAVEKRLTRERRRRGMA